MKQEVVSSDKIQIDDAVAEICSKLSSRTYVSVIFFASSNYDFEKLSSRLYEKFPQSEVIGTTTSGEISFNGFEQSKLIVSALSCTKTQASGVFIKNVNKFKISHIASVENAAKKIGIQLGSKDSHKNAFALTFVNGLCNAEENLLAIFYAIIKNEDFIIAGGSAGDDLKFKATYVSYNGEVTDKGAVILFIKTECRFEIIRENAFTSTGLKMKITEADGPNRKVISIDGQTPRSRYAEILGIPEERISDATLSHPLGRWLFGGFYITSIANFNEDGTMNMYSKISSGTVITILEKGDIAKITEETCAHIIETIPHPGCIFLVNCILRTLFFQQNDLTQTVNDLYRKYFPVYCGFSSYGEQIGRINSNQTLVAIAISED